jgi:hypothetical protein
MTRRRLFVALVVLVLLGASWADAAAQTTTGAAESEFARKTKCFEVGRLLYKDLTLAREPYDEGLVDLNPMYTYSKELNTCLGYFGWLNFREGNESRFEFVLDVLSNITILQSAKVGADALSPSDSDEFKRQLRAFFPDAP